MAHIIPLEVARVTGGAQEANIAPRTPGGHIQRYTRAAIFSTSVATPYSPQGDRGHKCGAAVHVRVVP
ncbi:MAG: hypothetical protein P4N59_11150 [Negativicutes bacterium]|nr:hypothetical protein [Negativicutes bacterium]